MYTIASFRYDLGEVNGINELLQNCAVSISWLIVIWLYPTATPLEPSEPDIVGRISWINDTWFMGKKRLIFDCIVCA